MIKSIVIAAAVMLGVALAPPAQAITNGNDRQRAEKLICDTIASDPSFIGMDNLAVQLLMAGLTGEQAGTAIALSIQETCPQYTKLALAWARSRG